MSKLIRENMSKVMQLRKDAKKVSEDEYTVVLMATNVLMKQYRGNPEMLKLKLANL